MMPMKIEPAPKFTGEGALAIHQVDGVDWHVFVNYTEDPNCVILMYRKPVDGQARSVPQMRGVPPLQLRNVEEVKDGNRKFRSEH